MKNILVATDFSTQAHHAFTAAIQLARRTGGEVTLLHVVDPPESSTGNFSTYGGPVNGSDLPNSTGMDQLFTLKLLEATRQRMQQLIAEAAKLAPGVPVHDAAEVAGFPEAVAHVVAERQIDLLVTGPQEHTSMENFFTTTHTEQLIREALCPVLAVKQALPDFDVRTVVFAGDFGAEYADGAPLLRQLLNLFPQAHLHLLYVTDNAQPHPDVLARMQEFTHQNQLTQTKSVVFEADHTIQGIQQYAWQAKADLIVVPTHVRSALSRLFSGSVAEAVAEQASIPVLTYHL